MSEAAEPAVKKQKHPMPGIHRRCRDHNIRMKGTRSSLLSTVCLIQFHSGLALHEKVCLTAISGGKGR